MLALETRDHTGTTGAQLDALVDGDMGGAPFSLVVAAYVKAGDTPGAKLARRVMGEQPWAQSSALVFPDVVLGLFANDVAKEGTGPKGARQAPARGTALVGVAALAPAARPLALADEATGVCSTLSGWVDSVIQTMVDALKVDTSGGGITGILGEIWNTVVDLAVEAGKQVVATLTAPIVAVVKTGLAIAGTLSMVAALLRPWSVTGEQQPSPVDYGIDPGSGNPAKIVATVDTAGSEPFTAGVVDCAKQAGVDLPDPTTAKGSKITWKPIGIDEVGTDIETDDVVGADDTASLRFTTKTESKEAAAEGTPVPHTTAVTIEVERTQVKDMQALLQTLLTGSIPGVAGQIASAVFGIITQPIFDEMATMLGTSSAATGTVISHTEPEQKPKATTTTKVDECAGLAEGVIPDGTWTGDVELDVDGSPTQASGAITSTGGGQMTITVAKGKVTSGTWTFDFSSSGTIEVQGGKGTIDSMSGKGGGTVAGTAAKPVLSGTGTISGQISVTVSGFSTQVPIDETPPDLHRPHGGGEQLQTR
ncbi:MAG: hypothetical protein U0P45_13440 [Acidimicrobiales bacterium]